MKKKKLGNIILGITYYTLGMIGFFYLFILTGIFGIIQSFSSVLHGICFLILPLLLLLSPIIIRKLWKKEFFESILFSILFVLLYFLILWLIRFSIIFYLNSFSVSKWNNPNYRNLRYLMIDGLEERYNFIGKDKKEVIRVLGKENEYDQNLCYHIQNKWLDSYYYCLHYDENNIITDTYET